MNIVRGSINATRSAVMLVALAAMLTPTGCDRNSMNTMNITKEPFGKTPDGTEVALFTLTNGTLTIKVTTYGGAITELWAPGKDGSSADIVLGFDSLPGYLGKNPYFGCLVGRYANRIAKGEFSLEGTKYSLAANDGPNHLHGGIKGFDKVVWTARPERSDDSVALTLTYTSRDGEEGYPGTLNATVAYVLDKENRLKIIYSATTDKTTIVNLTQHSYFNLAGAGSGDILGHMLTINARGYTPVDGTLIPTGTIDPVSGGPMDFTTPYAIGARIGNVAGGYDHNWVLDRKIDGLEFAARAMDPASGRMLEVWTTEPGIQFYSGNFLDGSIQGKGQKSYAKHYGFCLETQRFPDSPNRPSFPTSALRPGETYTQETHFRFSVMSGSY